MLSPSSPVTEEVKLWRSSNVASLLIGVLRGLPEDIETWAEGRRLLCPPKLVLGVVLCSSKLFSCYVLIILWRLFSSLLSCGRFQSNRGNRKELPRQ
jgi:hypothetical protein